VSVIEPFCGCI